MNPDDPVPEAHLASNDELGAAALDARSSAVWPVQFLPGDDPAAGPEDGSALCLSGGGSRAMLFHVGALIRLNELGLLKTLARVSGVSGGSITAAMLGLRWSSLEFDPVTGIASNLGPLVADPIRSFAGLNIDVAAAIVGVLLPGRSAADQIESAFQDHLYGDATLQDLPADADGPRFIFNATNLGSGVLWRFSRPYAWDWRVGKIANPTFRIATAVAASAAFPPFFAPLELDVEPGMFSPGSGDGKIDTPEFQHRIRLADGGVYDNLGLETIFKRYRTLYVSDGGGGLSDTASPPTDWPREILRVMGVIDHQVRSLRKRLLIAAYDRGDRNGSYWGIRQTIDEYPVPGALPCPTAATVKLANTPTRLAAMPVAQRNALVNWGYALADAAIRSRSSGFRPPTDFPYPGGVG